MTAYWLVLAGMLVVGVAVVLLPLLRAGAGLASTRVAAVLVTLFLPLTALTLYASVGTRPISNDFVLLWQKARVSVQEGDFATGLRSYADAARSNSEDNPNFNLDYAEALLQANPTALGGSAAELVERAIRKVPDDPRALWYGGLVAAQAGNFDDALVRWRKLLESGVPDDVRAALERQITALESHPGRNAPPETDAAPGIVVRVSLDDAMPPVSAETPVFVLARAPTGGPPLAAVRRSVADLPFTVTLSDADAMLAARKLSDHDVVTLVARVAVGGTPQASPGDIYASVDHNRGEDGGDQGIVNLAMDTIVK